MTIARHLTPRARQVLRLVRQTRSLSRSAMIRSTGLSGNAIFRATEELESAGLLHAGESLADGRGQPSAVMHIVPNAAVSVGLSIMTDRTDVLLLDLAGEVRARREITLDGMPLAATLDIVERFVREEMDRLGVPLDRLLGLGMAIAGYFVGEDRVNPAAALDDWALVDLKKAAGERLRLPVMVENIGTASALGEQLLGIGSGLASFFYVNVAHGFGGGIVSGGQVMRGHHGNAAEIAGLFHLAGRATPSLTSLRDCLERHGTACSSISDMVARFDLDWPGVAPWLDEHLPSFSYLFSVLRYTLDCESIILGGRMPRPLAQRIVDAASWPEAALSPRKHVSASVPSLHVAQLPPDLAAPLGAASLLLHREVFG